MSRCDLGGESLLGLAALYARQPGYARGRAHTCSGQLCRGCRRSIAKAKELCHFVIDIAFAVLGHDFHGEFSPFVSGEQQAH